MSTSTPNFNLEKPDSGDAFSLFRASYNSNMDIIDANLGGGGGSSTLAGLTDVDLNTPTDGQVLTFDGNSSKWINANGGGGSSVVPNPVAPATDDLEKIEINGVVYAINGGGGGSVEFDTTVLFEGTSASAVNTPYSLTDDIDNYDLLGVYFGIWSEYSAGSQANAGVSMVSVNALNDLYSNNRAYVVTGYDTRYMWVNFHDNTFILDRKQDMDVCKVVGYKVKGGGGGALVLGDCYSTTEREIGCWEDGKPLYQISLVGTGSARIDVTSLGIDTFCGVDSGGTYIIRHDTQQTLFLDSNNPQSANYGWALAVNSSNTEIEIITNSYSIDDYVFTIRYTKTADTAGSGDWTPNGVPTTHYSTSEQIIGSWIDGKTLYSRVFTNVAVPLNSYSTNLDLGCEVDTVVTIRVVGDSSIGTADNYYSDMIYNTVTRTSGQNTIIHPTSTVTATTTNIYVEYTKV